MGRLLSSLTNGKLVFVADFGAVSHCTVHMHDQKGCGEREREREPTLPPLALKRDVGVGVGVPLSRAPSVFSTLFECVFYSTSKRSLIVSCLTSTFRCSGREVLGHAPPRVGETLSMRLLA